MAAHDLRYYTLTAEIADVSTAGQCYVVVPPMGDGELVKIQTVLHNAITVADANLTAKINGTAVTGGTIVVAFTGSAAGTIDSCVPTGANIVKEGDALELETDGGSTTASVLGVSFTIAR